MPLFDRVLYQQTSADISKENGRSVQQNQIFRLPVSLFALAFTAHENSSCLEIQLSQHMQHHTLYSHLSPVHYLYLQCYSKL